MNNSDRPLTNDILAQIVAGQRILRPTTAVEREHQRQPDLRPSLSTLMRTVLTSRRQSLLGRDEYDHEDADSNDDANEWEAPSHTTPRRHIVRNQDFNPNTVLPTTQRTAIVNVTRQEPTYQQQFTRGTIEQQSHQDEITTDNNPHQYNDKFEKFKNAYKAGEDPRSFSKQFERHRQYFEERWQIKITPSDFLCCSTTYELLSVPCFIPNSSKPYDLNSIIKSKKADEVFFKDPSSRETFSKKQITGDDYRATFIESMLTELDRLYNQLNPPEATNTLNRSNIIEKLNNIDGLRVTNLMIALHQARHATLYSSTGANAENITDQQATHDQESLDKLYL